MCVLLGTQRRLGDVVTTRYVENDRDGRGRARGHLEGISERSSTRLHAPPGGVSSFSLTHDEGPLVHARYSDGRNNPRNSDVGNGYSRASPAAMNYNSISRNGSTLSDQRLYENYQDNQQQQQYDYQTTGSSRIVGLSTGREKSTRPW